MKIISTVLTALFFSLSSITVFAANTTQYTIFIDAGSSGSRVHIFQYENVADMPVINDVFSESIKPGLSYFKVQPESAGASLKKLFDDATQFLQKNGVDTQTVPLNVFATAGMRLLTDDQQKAIYQNVTSYLKNNYHFAPGEVETISGTMEGLYGWLDINYLKGTFQNHQPTVGSIDMGGASTQIAFETHDQQASVDEIPLYINHQDYRVFSKSFLGLGQDQALAYVSAGTSGNLCYPLGYPISMVSTGYFNYASCDAEYANLIQRKDVTSQMISTHDQPIFVAYSGVYYAYNFLNVDKTPDRSIVDKRIQNVCSDTWEQLKIEYSQIPEKYLYSYCANSVYISHLLYDTYQLHNSQLEVETQVNGKDIDWTLGAALYSIVHTNVGVKKQLS